MGTAAASAGAAGPVEGLRTERSRGRSKPEYPVAGGRRDHATFGSGPTRQSDVRDSEPDYLLRPTRHGQSMIYNSGKGSFYLTANAKKRFGLEDKNYLRFIRNRDGIFYDSRRCGFES